MSGFADGVVRVERANDTIREGMATKDWVRVAQGSIRIFEAHKDLGISEFIEDVGLLLAALGGSASFIILARMKKRSVFKIPDSSSKISSN